MTERVRVRFAPSPTGYLHVGGARTALYNWLFARHLSGTYILRIEDTDAERSTEESAGAILDALAWLGLDWDEGPDGPGAFGPYRQAQRLDRYRERAEGLVRERKAYYCICTPDALEARRKAALAEGRSPRYDGRCRGRHRPEGASAIRLLTEDSGRTTVDDLIHGSVIFENAELDDFILMRSDGFPTYNFACVVDDVAMAITHVVRGDDHLSNTPRQIQVYRALGEAVPRFAHIPMILGPDRARLSKRHGATSVMAYQEMGYLPEALVNYLARLGWSHGDQEIFSREELIAHFTLEKVGKTPAVFDPAKLAWLNGHYLNAAKPERLVELLRPFWASAGVPEAEVRRRDPAWLEWAVILFRERAKTLRELARSSAFLFDVAPEVDPEAAAKFLTGVSRSRLRSLMAELQGLPEFTAGALEALYRNAAKEQGLKLVDLAQPTRVALSGRTVSPPIFPVMELLGRDAVLQKLGSVLG